MGLLPTAPLYGRRKPPAQDGCNLHTVHDCFVQAHALAFEAACLLHWAHATWGKPLAVTGASYGGTIAALTSHIYSGALAVVPYMGSHGVAEPFSRGVLFSAPCMRNRCCPRLWAHDAAGECMMCHTFAGTFQGAVAWGALENVPEHPELWLPHRQPGRHCTAAVEGRFEEYCHFFTTGTLATDASGKGVSDAASAFGRRVVLQLMCQDDRMVTRGNALELFRALSTLARSTHEHSTRYTACTTEHAERNPADGSDGREGPAVELMRLMGGHSSGFWWCRELLPGAVTVAMARVEAQLRRQRAGGC